MTTSTEGREAVTVRVVPVDRLAEVLMEAWRKAEPGHPITLNMPSYVSTFADMARAVLAAAPSPAVPAQAGEAVRGAVAENVEYLSSIKRTKYGDGRLDAFKEVLRLLATPAPDADGLREARRHLLSGISLSVAKALVELFGGEDTDMTVEFIVDGHSGSGFYAWCTEYPEDGSDFLGPHFDVSEPAALAQPAESASGEAGRLRELIGFLPYSDDDATGMADWMDHASEAMASAASALEALQREKEALARKVDELIDNSMGLLGNEMRAIEAAQRAEAALASAEKRAEEAEARVLADKCRCEIVRSQGGAMMCFKCTGPIGLDKARETVAARAARGGQQ